MIDNYTVIKVSLYDVTEEPGSIHWHNRYDTSIIFLGIKNFINNFDSVYKLYNDYNLKITAWRNLYHREGLITKDIGIMIRGFKCYKYFKKRKCWTIERDYVIKKDVRKDFIKVV